MVRCGHPDKLLTTLGSTADPSAVAQDFVRSTNRLFFGVVKSRLTSVMGLIFRPPQELAGQPSADDGPRADVPHRSRGDVPDSSHDIYIADGGETVCAGLDRGGQSGGRSQYCEGHLLQRRRRGQHVKMQNTH